MLNRGIEKNKKLYLLPLVLRLAIYFAAVTAPMISSSVVVGYDSAGFAFWFLLVPAETLLAYLFSQISLQKNGQSKSRRSILITAALLPLLLTAFPGFHVFLPRAILIIPAIFIYSLLVFRRGVVSLVFFEPAFIYYIVYRLLEFSRASESSWQSSSSMIPLFYVFLIISYLFLSLLLYSSSSRAGGSRLSSFKKEILIFFTVLLPLLAAAVIFIPMDFAANDFILNFRDEKAISAAGAEGDEAVKEGKLSGIPSEKWGRRSRASSSGASKQYAVMIVASGRSDLYSAWDYLGGFNPVKGFVYSGEEPSDAGFGNPEGHGSLDSHGSLEGLSEKTLNSLKTQRLLETWINPYQYQFQYQDPGFSVNNGFREEVSAFFLSAISERVLPYLPKLVEPTLYSQESYPFSYSYNSLSMISPLDTEILSMLDTPPLSEQELEQYSRYLEVPLDERHEKIFREYISSLGIEKAPYNKKISAILKGFSRYQYELGYEEDSTVERLSRFIAGDFSGDCTEFSNAAALIGRVAGIPSRVVRGYLASDRLQSPSHLEALAVLKKSLDKIADIPLEKLKLVTTAHRHSWVQFYVPGFGWADFESTEYAIPPVNGDPNNAQVVIPIIREGKDKSRIFIFPWKMLISLTAFIIASIAALLYLYKAFVLSSLAIKSLKPVHLSFEARYKYILHRFFLSGYPIKLKTMTPLEYGEINREFREFASLFTELLYRDIYAAGEYDEAAIRFGDEYSRLMAFTSPKGALKFLKRFFSLRGVFY
ncbi:MAG: transglutaminase family protein [Spirochaetia bacterium]|jgi:transglutaminase-like putative cysteine protease|nr:transglutaminase family protein [Spirochaetia bacterium]